MHIYVHKHNALYSYAVCTLFPKFARSPFDWKFMSTLKRAGVPCAQLQHFYVAVIRPILEYAAPVWHHLLTNCQSDQIEAIQKRAINIIYSPTHGMPYSNALFFAGLSSLRARREQVARNFFWVYYSTNFVPASSTPTSTWPWIPITIESTF